MADDTALDLLKRLDKLKAKRSTWDTHWQEITERILPRQASITTRDRTAGEKRTDKIYEAQPALALDRFAAAMEAMITPRGSRWHLLKASDDRLNQIRSVKLWFDEANRLLFQKRYDAQANYASQQHETYIGLGALGSGCLWVGEDFKRGGVPFYRSIFLAQCYWAEDEHGFIDVNFRDYKMTARAIARQFKDNFNKLPDKIRTAANDNPFDEFEIVHVAQPRDDRELGRLDVTNMAFASIYIAKDGNQIIEAGGEHEFPYMASRYVTAPEEVYGRGPAMIVLPDIKMVNEQAKEQIIATHLKNRPPILTARDGLLRKIHMQPGKLNRGGITREGKQLVQPMDLGIDLAAGDIGVERRLRTIDDAFLVNLMRVLAEHPNMTATQALLLAQERGVVMGPTMGRQQSESVGPMVQRELSILLRNGHLPEMPQELIEAEGEYEIEYDSPINRAQRSEEGLAIVRTMEQVLPLVPVAPDIIDNFDTDEYARLVNEINGAPAKILRDIGERDARRQARAEQQQAAAIAEAAPGVGRAVKDIATAGEIASGGEEAAQ